MKSKAKPTKGSARTKRFDVGGTVGALAGLGTLAYLLSRKKKGEAESGGMSKDPNAPSVMDRLKNKADTTSDTTDRDEARRRALDQSKDPRANYMPEGSDRKELYSDINAKRTNIAPVVKKVKPVVTDGGKKDGGKKAVAGTNQGSTTSTGVEAGIAAGNKKDNSGGLGTVTKLDDNSPQAKAIRAQRDERTRQKFLQSRAGLSGTGITTAGDPNKKEATSKVAKAVQGTLDNAGKSTVRSDTDKMRERALEVERRRQEEKARKAGYGIKKGGAVKKMANGGSVSSASKRADGIAQRGKTRGKVY